MKNALMTIINSDIDKDSAVKILMSARQKHKLLCIEIAELTELIENAENFIIYREIKQPHKTYHFISS